jgi:hydroxymethylbilane synthase
MSFEHRLRLGTRGSALARWQAEWVAARLAELGVQVELVPISTEGDQEQQKPLGQIGGEGLFTKEIQRALLDGRVDLAVHSLKDLPTVVVPGLALASVPPRESPGDVLISRNGETFSQLSPGARLGTGSLRRRAQLLHSRPDLNMQDVRGNVDTRLRKLQSGDYDALVLAEAGIRRLELTKHITEALPKSLIMPAVGQGALGLEIRTDDDNTRRAVAALNDPDTHASVLAERALLAALRGGCLAPVGAWGRVEADGQLHLDATVLSADGKIKLVASGSAPSTEAEELGRTTAERLIAQGAAELISGSRGR